MTMKDMVQWYGNFGIRKFSIIKSWRKSRINKSSSREACPLVSEGTIRGIGNGWYTFEPVQKQVLITWVAYFWTCVVGSTRSFVLVSDKLSAIRVRLFLWNFNFRPTFFVTLFKITANSIAQNFNKLIFLNFLFKLAFWKINEFFPGAKIEKRGRYAGTIDVSDLDRVFEGKLFKARVVVNGHRFNHFNYDEGLGIEWVNILKS